MDPIEKFEVLPSYSTGFFFQWLVSPVLLDAGPWRFIVQQAPSATGPWTDISPVLVNTMAWIEARTRIINKDAVLHFRLVLNTASRQYTSSTVSPYGDLMAIREYNIAREIIRKEVLLARKSSGIIGKVWVRQTFGPRCTDCRDPVTGDVLNSVCPACFGTGRTPGYYGPYLTWMTFSTAERDEEMAQDGTGTRQPYSFSVKTVACPAIKDTDVIMDPCRDKRYYVDAVSTIGEIRRIALIQQLTVHEAPNSEPIYRLGR